MADDETKVYVIGRSENCDMVIDDRYASPAHAQVIRLNGKTWIEDLGSTNGTWLQHGDGPWAQVYGPTLMFPGDRVRIGRTTIPWTGASDA